MSEHIPLALQRAVRRRARNRCEYCLLPQKAQEAVFHVDHIHPRKKGGGTTLENLALACVSCSLKKAARTHATDLRTNSVVPLFHPRHEQWAMHFRWGTGWALVGKTDTGRATIRALGMNRPAIRLARRVLARLGVFRP